MSEEWLSEPPSPEEVEGWKPVRSSFIVFREVFLPYGRAYPWAELEVGESFWAPPRFSDTKKFGGHLKSGEETSRRVNGRTSRFSMCTKGHKGRVLVTRVA